MTADPAPHLVRVDRLLAPIFDQFLDIQRRRLDALDAALAAADFVTLERLGHAIKGGAATYQLPEAAALGADLEAAAAAGNLSAIARNILRLRRYFTSLDVEFTD